MVVIEAMLRGIPVLASDTGGLPEAKLGVEYVVPVNPIERYEARADEAGNPVPVMPPQNVEPWVKAAHDLLFDAGHYLDVSERSREVAIRFVSGLRSSALDALLRELPSRMPPCEPGGNV